VGYAGPASYSISSSQRATALSLEVTLDNYTNDSNSPTCWSLATEAPDTEGPAAAAGPSVICRPGGPRASPISATWGP